MASMTVMQSRVAAPAAAARVQRSVASPASFGGVQRAPLRRVQVPHLIERCIFKFLQSCSAGSHYALPD